MLAKLKDENELERELSSSPEPESSEVESNAVVECPVLGDLLKRKCLEYQAIPRKFATANPIKTQMWRACRSGCPNSLIGPDGDPIEIEESADPKTDQDAFLTRLKLLIEKQSDNNESLFARTAGISISGLKRYLAGGDPTRRKLIAIANANNVNLLWLATGEGPQRGASAAESMPCRGVLDGDALSKSLAILEGLGENWPLERKARALSALYEYYAAERPHDSETLRKLVASLLYI